jgi:hypothetical protein
MGASGKTMRPKRTKKQATIQIQFCGDGKVVRMGESGFSGGVPAPGLRRSVKFVVFREYPDRSGLWNPRDGKGTVKGGFQISVTSTSRGFRELGRFLLALAEIDSSRDDDYHEHVEALSSDGQTRLHFILRKRS